MLLFALESKMNGRLDGLIEVSAEAGAMPLGRRERDLSSSWLSHSREISPRQVHLTGCESVIRGLPEGLPVPLGFLPCHGALVLSLTTVTRHNKDQISACE